MIFICTKKNYHYYCYHYFYLWKLPCASMFLFAILEFHCNECFAYALVSFVFNIFCFVHVPQPYCIPFVFLVYCFPGFAILPSFPPQLQGPTIVCAVFAYPSFADPTCGPSMPQGGSDDTYFLQINPKFPFSLFTCHICAVVTQKCNPSPPHTGGLRALRLYDAAYCTS